jgi:hypothetical protein
MRPWIRMAAIGVGSLLAGLVLVFFAWEILYPSESDPRNMRYVAWRAGLCDTTLESDGSYQWLAHVFRSALDYGHVCGIDIDIALGTMQGDGPHKGARILGQTPDVLRRRFGFLLPVSQASEYLRRAE